MDQGETPGGASPGDDQSTGNQQFMSRRERREAERDGRFVPEPSGADELASPPDPVPGWRPAFVPEPDPDYFGAAPIESAAPAAPVPPAAVPPASSEPAAPVFNWKPPVFEAPAAEAPVPSEPSGAEASPAQESAAPVFEWQPPVLATWVPEEPAPVEPPVVGTPPLDAPALIEPSSWAPPSAFPWPAEEPLIAEADEAIAALAVEPVPNLPPAGPVAEALGEPVVPASFEPVGFESFISGSSAAEPWGETPGEAAESSDEVAAFDPFAELGFEAPADPEPPVDPAPEEADGFVLPPAAPPASAGEAWRGDVQLTAAIPPLEEPPAPEALPEEVPGIAETVPPFGGTVVSGAVIEAPAPGPEAVAASAPDVAAEPLLVEPPAGEPLAAEPPPESAALVVVPPSAEEGRLERAVPVTPLGDGISPLTDYGDLGRPTRAEIATLLVAFVVPLIGLIVAIVMAVRSSRSRGFAIPLNKAAILVSLLMTALVGVGVYFVWDAAERQREFEVLAAASAEFCAAAQADPAILAPPLYSWPREGDTIEAVLDEMQAFVDRWDALGAVAPEGIADGVLSIADRGRELRGTVETSRQIDDAQNVSLIQQSIDQSGVGNWVATYCPEAPAAGQEPVENAPADETSTE